MIHEVSRIFTNGCFDVLHRGHIELLSYCKTLGTVTVGLNSDASVRNLKGLSRPFNNQEDRKRLLESLRFVDEVVFFEEESPLNLIRKLKPDIIVKGGDYLPAAVIGKEICEVRIFQTLHGYSTSSLIEKFKQKF
jgi:D-beta-D-heptose 7-phosphate kinase/D-beta-D-heptose 1-phosphate adenosyltransferase